MKCNYINGELKLKLELLIPVCIKILWSADVKLFEINLKLTLTVVPLLSLYNLKRTYILTISSVVVHIL